MLEKTCDNEKLGPSGSCSNANELFGTPQRIASQNYMSATWQQRSRSHLEYDIFLVHDPDFDDISSQVQLSSPFLQMLIEG